MPAAKLNGSFGSIFASAITTSYRSHAVTARAEAVIFSPWLTFACAQAVRTQSVSST